MVVNIIRNKKLLNILEVLCFIGWFAGLILGGIKNNIIFTQLGINFWILLCVFVRDERILELEEQLKV